MGTTTDGRGLWAPVSEEVEGRTRRVIMAALEPHVDTLRLRGDKFTGLVAFQWAADCTFNDADLLTVACEAADKHLPVSVCCTSWSFRFDRVDRVDVVVLIPETWHRIDPDTGLVLL